MPRDYRGQERRGLGLGLGLVLGLGPGPPGGVNPRLQRTEKTDVVRGQVSLCPRGTVWLTEKEAFR